MSRAKYPQKKLVKIVVILGPTASGKSDLAVKLAKKLALSKIEGFNGAEIISADSRQVYRGMDIGTGKIAGKLKKLSLRAKRSNPEFCAKNLRLPRSLRSLAKTSVFISEGIIHYLIDIVSPKTDYNVAKFKKAVDKIIPEILGRGKVPIICGGTGFWIKAIVDNIKFPKVKPNLKLRKRLAKLPVEKIFLMLQKLDPDRAKTIDKYNKVRLIRAIEVAKVLGKVPSLNQKSRIKNQKYLQIGIDIPKEELHKRIKKRLDKRFKQGMIKEVCNLHYQDKISWQRLDNFGLEYRWIARFLQGKITEQETKEKLYQDIKNYARRQMTWFRKDKRIKWLKNYQEIEREVKGFLGK